MIGTISRWGTRGYGFVTCEQLDSEAWLHAKFLDDPEYEPRQGDRVEFDPERLPDGRYQARHVRPLDPAVHSRPRATAAPSAPSYPAYNDGRVAVKLSLPPILLSSPSPAALPAGPASVAVPAQPAAARALSTLTLVEPVSSLRRPDPAVPSPAAAAADEPAARPEDALADEQLGARLARTRTARQEEAAQLHDQLARIVAEAARLEAERRTAEARLAALEAGALGAERQELADHLEAARCGLERDLLHRRLLVEAHDTARNQAIARSGLPTVLEYEDVRRRLADMVARNDVLAQKAFRALERERRMTLRELADASDRLEAAPAPRARFVLFAEPDAVAAARVVLVAPLAAERVLAGGVLDPGALGSRVAHLACAFWQVAERASREGDLADANAEYGEVAGALAVRLPALDAGLLQLLLDDAWASRSELAGLIPELELVEGVAAPWIAEPEEDDDADQDHHPGHLNEAPLSASGRNCVAREAIKGGGGRDLVEVAARLGLTTRDVVALLTDRGLPFNDDLVEPGTEETLRALLGGDDDGGAAEARAGAAEPALSLTSPAASDDADAPESVAATPRLIAGRMLRKLLRDRRVGGRHTRIENAYGHHFSDQEKDVARRVAEWLEKDGILMPKLNEGSHHISINPRRLRDVGQIVDGTWERGADLDAV